MLPAEAIAPARIRLENGVPYAIDFTDIYHSPDGPQEVQRVFIQPCGLGHLGAIPERLWLGELGFGSGLNFAVLAEHCRQAQRPLHFVSCDAAPLHPTAFSHLAAQRAADYPIYRELAAAYPPLVAGWHRRYLADGLITVSMFWGDAQTALEDLARHPGQRFHSWFLDGFAPDRNPQMWSQPLLTLLGQLSAPAATIATFTAAGRVRRGLQAAGFEMRRVDQRPHKRESLAGVYRGKSLSADLRPAQAAVIGAGLAGASVAQQLARRGVAVTVYEAGPTPASGASSIPVSMLHPRLLADGSVDARLRCHAFLYSSAQVAAAMPTAQPACGALQLPGSNATSTRLDAVAQRYQDTGSWIAAVDEASAEQLSGWRLNSSGLWFPHSRLVQMPSLIDRLLDHPNIEVHCHSLIDLNRQPLTPTVLACAAACQDIPQTAYLELGSVHGQIDVVDVPDLPTVPLLGNGYVVPFNGKLALGSTYEYSPWDPARATRANLAQLPADKQPHTRWLSRHRGTRCVSSDRLPVLGAVFDQAQQPIPNLYVTTGMGSMGNVFSHYAGELLASQICGEFPAATEDLVAAMSSLRFRQRQERRGYRLNSTP